MPIVEELIAKARRFHALARATSGAVTKERLVTLGDDYLEQADQLKSQRTVIQVAYPEIWYAGRDGAISLKVWLVQ